jgi:hypothetical protein
MTASPFKGLFLHSQYEKPLMHRAVELGNSGNGGALPELLELMNSSSAQVRRLAVSAVGKLVSFADPAMAVNGLTVRLRDPHPQVRQYAVKALKAYGTATGSALQDICDIAGNETETEYNRRDAKIAVEVIKESLRIAEEQAVHTCQRCGVRVDADEFARSRKAFDRPYCDKCLDEIYLRRRNFDTQIELNKTIRAKDGTLVQSDGERLIAEWLSNNNITYRYDERIKIIQGYSVRPDFYLPEFDVYIEYWGMDTIDYKIGMLMKQKLYQQEGKRLISLYPEDKNDLDDILGNKIKAFCATTDLATNYAT